MGVREKFAADVAANVDLLKKAAAKAMAEGNETLAAKFEAFANAGRPGTPRTELPIQRDINEAKAYLESAAVKPLPPATSKAGKELAKKFKQLEEILTNSRDVRLPAAIDRRDKLAAQGMPTQQMDELIDQLNGQVTKTQAQLAKLRAEYGIEAPEGAAPSRPKAQQQMARRSLEEIDAELERNLARAQAIRAELYPKDRIPELIKAWRKVVGDDVRIRVLDSDKQAPKSEQWGGDGDELGDIAGMYEHWKDTIHIYQLLAPAKDGGRPIRYTFSELLGNGFHESFHRIVRMAMSGKDIAIINTPMARLKAGMAMDDWGVERSKIAYDELVTEAAARVFVARHNNLDPVAAIIDEIFKAADPRKVIPQWARDAATQVAGGLNKVYDFIEKSVNLFQGRGFESISTVFEKAASGQMRAADPSLRLKFDGENFSPVSDAGSLRKWKTGLMEDFAWDGSPVAKMVKEYDIHLSDLGRGRFDIDKIESSPFDEPPSVKAAQQLADLSSTLRQVDNGNLKGVSKKALDAAEKGDPEQALAEATDYAKRRLAEIDNKIESIKQRAIKEGC